MNGNEQIDKGKALRWLEGDERMFAKIREIFMKNISSQVASLRASLDAGDNGSNESGVPLKVIWIRHDSTSRGLSASMKR
jgi:hypothetical protein